MLSPETAEKRLKELRRSDEGKVVKEALAALPQLFQPLAKGLLGIDKEGRKPGARERALHQLEALPSDERDVLFRAFLPGLEDVTERAWNLRKRLHYVGRWYEKPFRAPNDPSVSLSTRGQWLDTVYSEMQHYPQMDVRWLAAWAPYLSDYNASELGILLAAAIDAGGARGDEVFEILVASGNGTHEIGAMGRHVTTALMTASRPEGWEFVEKMLLAAQRQEGLRQVILESVQYAHPEAFRRMIRLMREHNLIRFSAALRAIGGWFNFEWDVSLAKEAAAHLDRLGAMLDEPAEREKALRQGGPRDCFIALWTIAFEDAVAAVQAAARILQDPDPDRRFVAVTLLGSLGIRGAQPYLAAALDDPELKVAVRALYAISEADEDEVGAPPDLFPSLERLLARCPKEKLDLEVSFWPWMKVTVDRRTIAGSLSDHLGSRSPKLLIPYLSSMDSWSRAEAVRIIAKPGKKSETKPAEVVDEQEGPEGQEDENYQNRVDLMKAVGQLGRMDFGQDLNPGRLQAVADQFLSLMGINEKKAEKKDKKKADAPIEDAEIREALLSLVGDPAETVRQEALKALKRCKLSDEEAVRMEALLTRKASDLRSSLLKMLTGQEDAVAVASARRLLGAKHELQRAAGLELAQILAKAGRCEAQCREMIQQHSAQTGQTGDSSTAEQAGPEPTLENGLGLYDPAHRTPVVEPKAVPGFQLSTPAAEKLLHSLDDWIEKHKDVEYESNNEWQKGEKIALGSGYLALSQPNATLSEADDAKNLQLLDLWEEWWNSLPADHKDPDGGALIRACAHLYVESEKFWEEQRKGKEPAFRHPYVVQCILHWMVKLHPPANGADICLDGASTEFSSRLGKTNWRDKSRNHSWLTAARFFRDQAPQHWTPAHDARLFELLHWMDQPATGASRQLPELAEVCAALNAGAASVADLYDQLVGPRKHDKWSYSYAHTDLKLLSGRRGHPLFKSCPALEEVVERCRRRIVEIETARGEMETPVSPLALSLRFSGGADTVLRLLTAMGKLNFHRGYGWGNHDRGYVLSQLIRATYPREGETPESFGAAARAARIAPARLLDLAMYAPQWARQAGEALDWPDLDECVWWLHAHTKDDRWSVDEELREAWAAEVNLRTPLDATSLVEGAVDVEWFQRIHAGTTAERWKALDASAKYASGGAGHKRAQLFADAMLGRISAETLLQRMQEKRNGDAVRAYGLVPLAEGEAREKDLLTRYQALQEFVRTGKDFGSMRQASEKLAVQIAMDNLSRTAGYPDPIRLQWAMERKAIGDLAKGPVTIEAEGVTVRLWINPLGEAVVDASRDGKPLKSVPPAVKKLPEVKELDARKREVGQQTRRMRKALEEAMVRGDAFRASELSELMEHPVLAKMLQSLVFVGDGAAGYPTEDGRGLESHTGDLVTPNASAPLRIAHPVDLLATGEWHLWQKECFLHERVQPFKQVFRELYVLTDQERVDGTQSLRYAGHQVNPGQALALLGKRSWIARPEEGVQRVYHRERIVAQIEFNEYFTTPADVEGLTVESVSFLRRGDWETMKLEEVPPRLFSEVMRDVDLMVSVAHQGGVDPEASASTVEMRAALIEETCRLLKLENVCCEGSHARIEGKLANYSVHLGSGVVHRQPGGFLCIVPVHGQHKGRLFLPFVDDDPRTAEVVSKTLMLAKDTEIKDPIILEQILPSR